MILKTNNNDDDDDGCVCLCMFVFGVSNESELDVIFLSTQLTQTIVFSFLLNHESQHANTDRMGG